MRGRTGSLLLAMAVLTGPRLGAQQQDPGEALDRIVAVVGNTPILYTQILEQVNVIKQSGGTVPEDSAQRIEFERQVLEGLIEEELLVQAAHRDTSVVVTDQQVQSAVDEAMSRARRRYASELEYVRALRATGFNSPDDYRSWLTERQRRQLEQDALWQSLRDHGRLRPIPPTDKELKEFFELTKTQTKERPATVTFRQIVITPEADTLEWDEAKARADSLFRELRRRVLAEPDSIKQIFQEAARKYSDEPGADQTAGNLGWFRRGQMVPAFDRVAFRLRPLQISPPIKTEFGYHLIMVERIQPAERQARHILLAPNVTDKDRERAKLLAEQIARDIRDGKVSFDSMLVRYHKQDQQSLAEDVIRSDLPQVYQSVFDKSSPGDLIGPVYVDLGEGRPYYAIIRFENAKAAGEYTLDEIRDQISSRLGRQLARQRFVRSLREATYVEIKY